MSNKMNKNGFTLVEILAVIVVLGLIVALIIPRVVDFISDSKKNSYDISTKMLIKALNTLAVDKKATMTPFSGCSIVFDSGSNTCTDLDYSGDLPTSGNISVDSDGVVNGTLVFDKVTLYVYDSIIEYVSREKSFAYKGEQQIFNVDKSGYYKLEVWGAQGGNSSNSIGGYGGYSSGYMYLEEGATLYINVGGSGKTSSGDGVVEGGYNGGGNAYVVSSSCDNSGGSGGGATHIALRSGLLSTFSANDSDLLLVAGGGGGASYRYCKSSDTTTTNGGDGGGFNGNQSLLINTTWSYSMSSGGSNSSGGSGGTSNHESGYANGSFGAGASYARTGGYTLVTGGGAGYYGGGAGSFVGGGGGSGYIGNISLVNKKMYCYNCSESIAVSSNTISTTNVSSEALNGYAKIGDGYAKITYVGTSLPNSDNSVWVFDYTGDYQEFVALKNGKYKIELWGARGGESNASFTHVDNNYGLGGYTSGILSLSVNEKLYVYVGQQGYKGILGASSITPIAYNGGGSGAGSSDNDDAGGSGGGATDVRLVSGEWDNFDSLKSRIMVAAGGAGGNVSTKKDSSQRGGYGGGLTGVGTLYRWQNSVVTDLELHATQTSGYRFGVGASAILGISAAGSGAGGGYYGGKAQTTTASLGSAGGGGSSYISGYDGCNSISADSQENSIIHTDSSIHYSNKVFTSPVMKAGNDRMPTYDGKGTMVGNSGYGYAKITYIGN